MATEPGNQEFLTLCFQPEAREQVFEALGGLMADGVVEVAFDPHQPERPYNPDVVETVVDPATGEPIPVITPETFRRAAIGLGMDEAMGSRAHSAIARHFRRQSGLEAEDPAGQLVSANFLPDLVRDLREDRVAITNLGRRSLELLESLLSGLYLSEDQIE